MLETGHGLAVPLKLCAFAHPSSDTVMSYAFTQQSRETPTQNQLRSDLRLGRDGMKLQPAGSHQSRLSAGPPAVPSSSSPVMKLNAFYHLQIQLVKFSVNLLCISASL